MQQKVEGWEQYKGSDSAVPDCPAWCWSHIPEQRSLLLVLH